MLAQIADFVGPEVGWFALTDADAPRRCRSS